MKSGFYDFVLLFQCVYLGFVVVVVAVLSLFLFPFVLSKA